MEPTTTADTETDSVSGDQENLNERRTLYVEEAATADTVPNSLAKLISSFGSEEISTNEWFTLVLYVTSAESGFTTDVVDLQAIPLRHRHYSFDAERVASIRWMDNLSWRNAARFQITVYLGAVEEFACVLAAVPYADKLIVNISSSKLLLCFSSVYVPSQHVNGGEGASFIGLKELCTSFRDNLFHPIKAYLLTDASLANPSLIGISIENIVHVARYLELRDFVSLCSTCKFLRHSLYDESSVWIGFCRRYRYGTDAEQVVGTWKTHFLENFLKS